MTFRKASAPLVFNLALTALLPLAAGTAALAPLLAPQPALAGVQAVDAARIDRLGQTLQLTSLMAVLREEGLDYAEALDTRLLAGQGGPNWTAIVARLYDPAVTSSALQAALGARFATAPEALARMEGFYDSELGQRIIASEIAARRAFLDPAAKDEAALDWQKMEESRDPRAAAVKEIVATLDVVDLNVEFALNSQLAFYRGMQEGGALPDGTALSDVEAEVAAQEPATRAGAEAWLYAYMGLAYRDLSDADLAAFRDYLASPGGRAANDVWFAAMSDTYTALSRNLGRAMAAEITGQDI